MDFDHSIDKISPSTSENIIEFGGEGIILPVGPDSGRPPNSPGLIRYNTTRDVLEFNNGSGWSSFGQTYDQLVTGSSVLISKFIPEGIWNAIVAGTNTTPVGTYIQAALTSCAISHATLIFSPYTYLIEIGLEYDYGSHSIIGNGAKLDFSNTNPGVTIAFSIVTPHNYYPLWDSAIHSLHGLNIKGYNYGAGRPVGLTGVQFGVGLADTGAHAAMQNCSVSGFDTLINFGHHSYVQKIDSCAFHNGNIAVLYSGISLEDSGERIGFTNCVIFNSNTLVKAISGNISLSNCSFDYFTEEAIVAEYGGSVYVTDSHVESINNPNLKPWFVAQDSNSRICFSNTIIVVNEPVSVYMGIADDSVNGSDTGSADAGIFLVNTHISFTPTGEYTLQTLFKGAVYISNMSTFDGGRYSPSNKRVHVHVDRNNLLANGSFESSIALAEWISSTGSTYNAPIISTNLPATGTKSLRLQASDGVSTTSSKIYKSFLASPGAKPTIGFKARGSIPVGSNLVVTVGYATASGFDSSVASRTFVYNYTATEVSSSSWSLESIRPYSRAPIGTSRVYVSFEATVEADVYIDDVIFEVLDNSPTTMDLSDVSINSLKDVDTISVPPTTGQALLYNSTSGIWAPGTVSGGGGGGGLSASAAEVITGRWEFVNGGRLARFDFSGGDITDKVLAADGGITFNYSSSYSGVDPFPYYRDFTVFNGKGLAAMKIFGATRTALFYSKMQFGNLTAGANQIGFTGGEGDPGDTAEIAINYNSGYDATTNVYSFPYWRSFHIFDGKGGSLLKASGNGRRIDFNTDNVYMFGVMHFKGYGGFDTQLYANASAQRYITIPDASGTIALQEWATPLIAAAANTVAVRYTTADYSALTTDNTLLVDVAIGQTITLPAANANTGKLYRISNVGANAVTLTATQGSIQWGASQSVGPQVQRVVVSDGNNWFWC
jgi:hypothetical protein